MVATSINNAPTLAQPTLSYTVAEGGTVQNLYAAILANTSDVDPGDKAQITISTLGLSGTVGSAYLDAAHQKLTYTADGYNAKQPLDSFGYTVSDGNGGTATGTIAVTVTPSNSLSTTVGTTGADTLTASSASSRLIGLAGNDTLKVNAAKALVFAGAGDDTVTVGAAKATIYGGTGTNTITLGDTAQDSIVLQQGGLDQIFGFNLTNGDQLDLRQALAESMLTASLKSSDPNYLGNYLKVTPTGSDTSLSFYSNGASTGAGSTLAVLHSVGQNVTLQTLINDNVLRIS